MAISSKTFKVGVHVDADGRAAIATLKQLEGGLDKLAGAGLRIAGGFAAAATAMSGFAVKMFGKFEQTQLAFESIIGNAERAKKLWKDLVNFASQSPLPLDQLKDGAQLLLAFGHNADAIVPKIKLLGTVVKALGLPGGMEQAVGSLEMLRAGRFNIAQLAPLGITRDALRARGVRFYDAAMQILEDRFAKMADRADRLLTTRLGNVLDNLQNKVAPAVGNALAPMVGEFADKVNDLLEKLVVSLEDERVQKAIQDSFQVIVDLGKPAMDWLEDFANKLAEDPDSIANGLRTVAEWIEKAAKAILWIVGANVAIKLLTFLGDAHSKAVVLSKGLTTLAAAMNGSAVAAGSLSVALKGLLATYGPLLILATAIWAVVRAVQELSKYQFAPGVEADPRFAGKIAGIAPKDAAQAATKAADIQAKIAEMRKNAPEKYRRLSAEFTKEKGSLASAGAFLEWFEKRLDSEAAGIITPADTQAAGEHAGEKAVTFLGDYMTAFVGAAEKALGKKLRITSTTGGKHNKGSLHPKGLAFDIGGSVENWTDAEVAIMRNIAKGLGIDMLDERTRPKGQAVWGGAHLHFNAGQALRERLSAGTAGKPEKADILEAFLKEMEDYFRKLAEAERALEEQRYQNRLAGLDGLTRLAAEEEQLTKRFNEAFDKFLAATDPIELTENATEIERVTGELSRVERDRLEIEKQLILAEQRRNFEFAEFIRGMDALSGEGARETRIGAFMVGLADTFDAMLAPLRAPMTAFESKAQKLSLFIDEQIQAAQEWTRQLFEMGVPLEEVETAMQPFINAIRSATSELEAMNVKIGENASNIYEAILGGGSGGIGGIVTNLMPLLNQGIGKLLGVPLGGTATAGLSDMVTKGLGVSAGGPWGMAIAGLMEVFSGKVFNKIGGFFNKLFGGGKEEAPKVRGIPAVWVANIDQMMRGFTLPTSGIYSGRYSNMSVRVNVGGVNLQAGRDTADEVGKAVTRAIERELSRVPL